MINTTNPLKKALVVLLPAIRHDTILSISLAFALLSAVFVPPSAAWLGYIDLRVLSLLFCLMAVVAGFQECGLFISLAHRLLSGENNFRQLAFVLVMLPFFSSMLITNDVALITFVPFTILILNLMGQRSHLPYLVVLQTIAANLGSMTTPVGNPQNLYLYGRFQIPALQFFACLLPLTLLSFLLLTVCIFRLPRTGLEIHLDKPEHMRIPRQKTILFSFLFLLCLLCVFRLIPYEIVLAAVIICLFLFDRPIFKQVDYLLLLTFVCFFIFAGNMGNIPAVKTVMAQILNQQPVLFSALLSQIISNVPAAVLLSGFTDNWKALLTGTNLGGLGTPVASLASLISLKFMIKEMPDSTKHYLAVFFLLNILFFVLLYICALLLP